jgi:hypothetical protein
MGWASPVDQFLLALHWTALYEGLMDGPVWPQSFGAFLADLLDGPD